MWFPENQHTLSRRVVLRGLGAAVTLPWLESVVRADTGIEKVVRGVDPEKPPVRYAALVFGQGIDVDNWDAEGTGDHMKLSKTLRPLEPFKRDINVLKNLHIFDNTTGFHFQYFSNLLACAELPGGPIPKCGQSVDQFMAQHLGGNTAIPSLALGIEPVHGGLRGGTPDIMWGTVTWRDANTPIPTEIYPQQAFDSLFDTSAMRRDRSVLDVVFGQAKDLRRNLSRRDQTKLDEYLTSVDELEKRIDAATRERPDHYWKPSLTEPNMARPPSGIPERQDHFPMMVDLIALAFEMDRTRIATLLFNRDSSQTTFEFLDGVGNKAMHLGLSHHQYKEAVMREFQITNEYHVSLYARLIGKLKSVQEGERTLLDNSMLLLTNSMDDGNKHTANHLPVVLAGAGGGTLKTGQVLEYTKTEDRRLANLHLACAQRMGIDTDQFANSHYPLPGLI